MPEEVKAIFAYTPRIVKGKVVEMEELIKLIAGRTSINEGALLNVLSEFREAVEFFAMSGRPVRLKGLGIFSPKIYKDGEFGINYLMDKRLKRSMNVKGKFTGDMVNREMIGKSVKKMIRRWNREHPDDQIDNKK